MRHAHRGASRRSSKIESTDSKRFGDFLRDPILEQGEGPKDLSCRRSRAKSWTRLSARATSWSGD